MRSTLFADTSNTLLGRAIADRVKANPAKTGIHPLPDGRGAFAARVLLAQAAERSLDLQYFIWQEDTTGQLLSEAVRADKDGGVNRGLGSCSSALHAKTFAVDRTRIFVGSFNLDPRSARLNTEMGVVLDSPALAKRLSEWFDTVVPNSAYEVRLGASGNGLEWHERTAAGGAIFTREPKTGLLKRFWIEVLTFLPIEWLL